MTSPSFSLFFSLSFKEKPESVLNVFNSQLKNINTTVHSSSGDLKFIAELTECSPIIIQNGSSNPSSQKNLDLRPYNRTTPPYKVLLLTCVVNCTAGMPAPWLCRVVQWSLHWAPSQTTQVLVLARARHCALEICRGKKWELCFYAWLNLYISP